MEDFFNSLRDGEMTLEHERISHKIGEISIKKGITGEYNFLLGNDLFDRLYNESRKDL